MGKKTFNDLSNTSKNTIGEVTLKDDDDTSLILPTEVTLKNVNDYFEYSITGDEVSGATYTFSIARQDNENGFIYISLIASQAFVNGDVKSNKTIVDAKGFPDFSNFYKNTKISNLKFKDDVDKSKIIPSTITPSNASNFFEFTIDEYGVPGATYSFVIDDFNDKTGVIYISLVASHAFVAGSVLENRTMIDEQMFNNMATSSTKISFKEKNNYLPIKDKKI